MILQEAPHLAQHRDVLDLIFGQRRHGDARARVELAILVENRRRDRTLGRVVDRHVVHEKLQVVGPHLALPHDEHTKEELACFGIEGQTDRVLGPVGRSPNLSILHVVELKGAARTVLSHPQTGELADVLGAEEAPKLEPLTAEVDRELLCDRAEGARALRVTLDPSGTPARSHDARVEVDGLGRAATPSKKGLALLRPFEPQDGLEVRLLSEHNGRSEEYEYWIDAGNR